MIDMLQELYQEMILDHGKSPRNFREIANCTHKQEAYNPLCGDRITLYVDIHQDTIDDVAFTGQACAICTASASMLTEAVKGKMTGPAHALFERFHHAMTGTEDSEELGKLAVLSGVKAFPMRIKCATLPWHALEHVLQDKQLHNNSARNDSGSNNSTYDNSIHPHPQMVTTE